MTEGFEQQVAAALAAIPHNPCCRTTWEGSGGIKGEVYDDDLGHVKIGCEPDFCDREARLVQAVAAAIAAATNYYSATPQHKQDRALRALRGERP